MQFNVTSEQFEEAQKFIDSLKGPEDVFKQIETMSFQDLCLMTIVIMGSPCHHFTLGFLLAMKIIEIRERDIEVAELKKMEKLQ